MVGFRPRSQNSRWRRKPFSSLEQRHDPSTRACTGRLCRVGEAMRERGTHRCLLAPCVYFWGVPGAKAGHAAVWVPGSPPHVTK